jgi:hypothetical protein
LITAILRRLAKTTQQQVLIAGIESIMAIRIRIRVIFMGGGGNINGDARR